MLSGNAVLYIYVSMEIRKINSYRPLSILPVISKIFEKKVNNEISKLAEENEIVTPGQYGFLKGNSTDNAVIHFICSERLFRLGCLCHSFVY